MKDLILTLISYNQSNLFVEYDNLSADELNSRLFELDEILYQIETNIADEETKFTRYKVKINE